MNRVKSRLHQIHVAGYKYPGQATCIRIQLDTCRRNAALTTILSPIQDVDGDKGYKWIGLQVDTTCIWLHVSGVNAA